MGLSLDLGQILGIRLRAHFTFLIMLILGALAGAASGGIAGMFQQAIFTALLFGLVVLHELGHAMAARSFGIRTHDILLLPVGGMARLERQPATPQQEILVALAGPAVNMALATLLMPLAAVAGHGLIEQLLWANVSLALFNLIPAFPMDGGRVLRAGLTWKLGPFEATRIAATIGKGASILLGVFGLFFEPFLVLIATFVWFLADQEESRLPLGPGRSAPSWSEWQDPRQDSSSWMRRERMVMEYRPGTGWVVRRWEE
jgi:Zn-dependent protease